MTLFACRKYLENELEFVAGDCALVEAEQILMVALECSRSFLYAYSDRALEPNVLPVIQQILRRRKQGEPLQYIFGKAPFMGLEFIVRPGVLIPRRDTEILVEHALPYCKGRRVLDLCTGSGCIGISVARLGEPDSVALSDVSSDALGVAMENARLHQVSVFFLQGDFLQAVPEDTFFDVILSNPPYISTAEMPFLPADVQCEPEIALKAGADGLDAYRTILQDVSRVLTQGGYLFFEIGYSQGHSVRDLMERQGFCQVQILRDYGGKDRVVFGRLL